MRKGFTLIELLAVIVILAIILAIAIPSINNIIENTKIEAHVNNERTLLKAAQNYMSANNNQLPIEIGDSIELTLTFLQEKNYINIITDPKNSNVECNGYVMVTKINDGKYDYTPHLDCENEVESASEDKLVAHYKFDDFQEPTENLLADVIDTTFESGSTSGWGISGSASFEITNEILFDKKPVIKLYADNDSSGGISATTNIRVPENTMVSMSLWIYIPSDVTLTSNWEIHRHALPDGVCLGGSCHHYSSIDYTNKDWDNDTPKNQWIRRDIVIKTDDDDGVVDGYNLRIFCYANGSNPVGSYIYMTQPQIELKSYPTPFTPNLRDGIVMDYSGKGNHATLTLSNTPKWTEDSILGDGAYEFDGDNDYINCGNSEFFNIDDALTVTAWVKFNNLDYSSNTGDLLGIAGKGHPDSADPNYGWWFSYDNRSNKEYFTYTCFGNSTGGYGGGGNSFGGIIYGQTFNNDEWYHLAFSITTTEAKLFINGEQQGPTKSISNLQLSDLSRPLVIGSINTGTSGVFNGIIDDVRIYNRVVSEDEIKLDYQIMQRWS